MRIVHVLPWYWPATEFGGPVQSVANLARGQHQLGHDVVVLTTNLRAVAEAPVEPGWRTVDGVRVSYAAGFPPPNFVVSPGLVRQLWRTIRAGVDIVHLHCLWVSPTVMGARICELSNVPYVAAPRGCLNRWALEQKQLKKRIYMAMLEERTLRKAVGLHYTSHAERAEVPSALRALPSVVVPNAIRLEDLLALPPLGQVPDELAFLIVGRIHPVKGFDVLLPALAAVRDAGRNFSLSVAGGDEGGYEDTVRAIAKEQGLSDRIRFLGRLDRPQLVEQLARATAVLVPSYQESFGMAAAEGMAAGRPVLVTEGVNIASEVRAAGAGLVSRHGVDELAASILSLIDRVGELPEMGRRGQQYIAAHYAPEVVAKDMVEKYEHLLSRRA